MLKPNQPQKSSFFNNNFDDSDKSSQLSVNDENINFNNQNEPDQYVKKNTALTINNAPSNRYGEMSYNDYSSTSTKIRRQSTRTKSCLLGRRNSKIIHNRLNK